MPKIPPQENGRNMNMESKGDGNGVDSITPNEPNHIILSGKPPKEWFNKKCGQDPMLLNEDDCGNFTLVKKLLSNYTSESWKCQTLSCLCPYFHGTIDTSETKICILPSGKALTKAIRKEYRMLTDEERKKFHDALKKLMKNGIYDEISAIHLNISRDDSYHNGNKFWNWHTGYLKRLEIELRKIDPDVALPYWDSTLDENLPVSSDSIIWTDDFMGRSDENGIVISGPAAYWTSLNGQMLRRRPVLWGPLVQEGTIKYLLDETQLYKPRNANPKFNCSYQIKELYEQHGTIHHYVGGDLQDLPTATNDPAFFLHHCFVDLIFELWRQQKDPSCHVSIIIDDYIDETFEYAPRPTCSYENPDCGSKYLFCDPSDTGIPSCITKISPGGLCSGIRNSHQACLDGYCNGVICVSN
uniref:Tyrosinase copper-binding domain-containing protein n=1 Tax=Acrobeloides nanus TaxID=290746 RepID=A0A914C0B7_9BILA